MKEKARAIIGIIIVVILALSVVLIDNKENIGGEAIEEGLLYKSQSATGSGGGKCEKDQYCSCILHTREWKCAKRPGGTACKTISCPGL